MIIKSIELKNYRNYDRLNLDFSEKTNILFGNNAQGKTNILEAIYVCATTRSHRGSKDKEIIRFDREDAHICMHIERSGVDHKIDMHLKRSKTKGAAVDGIIVKRTSELFGVVNVVFFSPEDLSMIKEGPGMRRRFADMELCQLDKIYLHHLTSYNRVLQQRNQLLRQIALNPALTATLDVWDEQLIRYGTAVMRGRSDFIDEINDLIQPIHRSLTGDQEELKLVYEPDVHPAAFAEMMTRSRETDMRQKMTTTGPHRDDILFLVNGIDIRKFGSQGQQRTAALSLKLAEISLVKKRIQDTPVLLLDDVLSELDSDRQRFLMERIQDIQTVVTCTGLEEFIGTRLQIDRVYKVVSGTVKPWEWEEHV